MARRNLAEETAREIQRKISLGTWSPGQRLPTEPALMKLFGVGRSTVREAVRVLSHAGVLLVRQGDGTYVGPSGLEAKPLEQRLKRGALLEVYEVRRALELEAARLAAERRDRDDVAAMADALARRAGARKIDDQDRFVDADVAFHEAVAAAGKNAVLADLYHSFAAVLRSAIEAELRDEAVSDRDSGPQHVALLRAIERRDPPAAVRAAAAILDRTTLTLRRLTSAKPRPRKPS